MEWSDVILSACRLQQGLQDKGYEEWVGEMIGMREILRHFANVSRSDVTGMRAPYLKPGRNTQYEVSPVGQLAARRGAATFKPAAGCRALPCCHWLPCARPAALWHSDDLSHPSLQDRGASY